MSAQILIAYATRYGSTREVAETIAASLRERELAVDVRPAREVRSLEGYRAVVLGAPLYIGRWHGDAGKFLAQYREALAARPVAIFALGPLRGPSDETGWQTCRAMLDGELAKTPWLAPVALEMFGGKYDPTKLGFRDNLIAALPASPLHGMPASDVRDWAAIRTWASDLAERLQTVSPIVVDPSP